MRLVPPGEGLHLVLDSTGLSIVGAGEWAAAKHGGRGRRGWRKLHRGVDQAIHLQNFDAPILGPAGRSPQEAAHDLPTRCPGPGRHDPRAAPMTPASERFQSLATANRLFTATTKTAPPRKSTRFAMTRVTTSPM